MFVMVTFVASLIHPFLDRLHVRQEHCNEVVEDHEVHADDGGHYKRRGRFGRFFLFLSLFSFSMLNLLLADNLFQIFVSWELVGICSFLLIGFYFERTSASNAANKAFITNFRIGDAGFIIQKPADSSGHRVGTFNFEEIIRRIRCEDPVAHATRDVRSIEPHRRRFRYDEGTKKFTISEAGKSGSNALSCHARTNRRAISFDRGRRKRSRMAARRLSFRRSTNGPTADASSASCPIGCVESLAGIGDLPRLRRQVRSSFRCKCGCPNAMEGPTPVGTSLIHAATMVAASVYLVGSMFPLFTYEVLLTIAYIERLITGFVGASIAVVQTRTSRRCSPTPPSANSG